MAGKKMTILDFQKYKDEGRKFSYVTDTLYLPSIAGIIRQKTTFINNIVYFLPSFKYAYKKTGTLC